MIAPSSEQIIFTWRASARSAATPPARSPSGLTASLYISDRRQHEPVRLRRLHADRRAARPRVLGRPAHFGEQRTTSTASSCASCRSRARPASPGIGTTYTIPAGNMFADRARPDAARDLRDGLPQPVPDHDRSEHGLGAAGRLRPRRRRHRSPAAARRAASSSTSSSSPASTAGPTASATTSPYNDYNFAERTVRPAVQLRRAGQQLAQQHGHHQPAAARARHDVDGLHRDRPAVPRPRHRRRADRRPALPVRPGPQQPDQVPRVLRRRTGSSASGTTAGSGPRRWTPTATRTGVVPRRRARTRSPGRTRWSSALTARST